MGAHNFFAGPAVLPAPVIEAGIAAMKDFAGMGMSILEISHRSKQFEAVVNEADADLRELMGIPANYKIAFLTGGASTQFAMVPMNLMKGEADYINTGEWSKKAIKEAKLFGKVNVIATGEATNFNQIPKEYKINPTASYLHVTSNNTIFGTQWHSFPESGDVPMVCDMSSDIMCRVVDVSKFGMIYAGAQKNMGPAGVTVVIIREDLIARTPATVPTMFKYSTHIDNMSLYNTPPVYPIYIVGQVLKWLKSIGGIKEIERINNEKAAMLYAVLDKFEIYKPHAMPCSRSLMNVTWKMANEQLEEEFDKLAKQHKMFGLKGHRSVGGMRASIYNACPVESVKALCDLLTDFAQKHA